MGRPVIRFEVMGDDAALLHSFYREMFDWKIGVHGRYGLVEGAGLAGGIGAAPGAGGHVTIYVEVPDVEVALAEAERLGGARIMGPMKVRRGVELGQFRDPEGHRIGLIKAT